MPIRVLLQQPALPHYRVPVFAELARRPGIQLHVDYGEVENLHSEPAEGFDASYAHTRTLRIMGRELLWVGAQWRGATRRKADVAIFSWNLHSATLIPALLRARMSGVGTVLWGHGYSKVEARWRSVPRRKVAELADALLFYTRTVAKAYIRRGWDPQRVFVADNSIDQRPIEAARERWLADPARLHQFKAEHDLVDAPVILFVSRLDPDNRLDLLIQALPALRAKHPRMVVAIVGRGDPEQQRLVDLAERLGVSSHVRWLGAIHDQNALAPWFLIATALCYPANIGLSILHAFGYGLPVVTGDDIASHNPEIEALEDQRNGLLFRHGDPASLVETLDRLIGNRSLRTRLGEAALRTVRERYNVPLMVNGMESAIRFAANRRAGRA